VAVLLSASGIAPTIPSVNSSETYSVEESSVRATTLQHSVLRKACCHSNTAILLTLTLWAMSPTLAEASTPFVLASPAVVSPRLVIEQFQVAVFAQVRQPQKKPAPAKKKVEAPVEVPQWEQDKLALPPGFKLPSVSIPELSIVKELPVPDPEDKAAWKAHRSKISQYSAVLIKGRFGDEKAERDLLRYGITYRLNLMTHRSLLYPSDEERTKVVETEEGKKPEAPDTLISVREDLISDLRKASGSNGEYQIRDAFLDIFVEESAKLLDKHTFVRFQVGYLLSIFNSRDEDRGRGQPEVPLFKALKLLISIVSDEKTHFLSKIYPVRGLARMCRHKDCRTDERFQIIDALIKEMGAAKTIHWWYGETVAESLSNLGDPHDRAKNPAVAEALFSVIKDPGYADRVRVRAAHSIARIPLETFKRTDEIAIANLRPGYELGQGHDKEPKMTRLGEGLMNPLLGCHTPGPQ